MGTKTHSEDNNEIHIIPPLCLFEHLEVYIIQPFIPTNKMKFYYVIGITKFQPLHILDKG